MPDFDAFDYIVAMDSKNLAHLKRLVRTAQDAAKLRSHCRGASIGQPAGPSLRDAEACIASQVVEAERAPEPDDHRRDTRNIEDVIRAGVDALELRNQERYEAKLSELRAAIDEGDASGAFEGNPFDHVRAKFSLPIEPR